MSPDILAVLAGVVAAAVYIICSRSMAARGGNAGRGGGSAGGGRSAGSGRGSIPSNGGTGKTTGVGKSGAVPSAGKANSGRTGKGSNWNADGTHGSNYDKGAKGKAGTQGSKGAAGKAAPAGSGKVTTVRGNVHGSNVNINDDGSSKVGDAASAASDLVSNTAAPGNDNDGGNMVGGDFGDVPVTGTTSVSFDANGDIITDERAGTV